MRVIRFLDTAAQVVEEKGSDASLRQLSQFKSNESVLWHVYALIQRGEFEQAERMLESLPADDGYAAVYRIYCAEAQGDTDRARDLYQVAKNSINPPRDYLNVLDGFYFAQIDDVAQVVDFDWVDGEALATGWLKETPATGITIGIQSSELVFKGTQQRSATPVNRAWRLWPKRGIRQVSAKLNVGAAAYGGIEFTDSKRESGFALGVSPEKNTVVRQLRAGEWSDWQVVAEEVLPILHIWFDEQAQGVNQIQLRLDQRRSEPLASLFALPTTEICIGFFGYAEPGVNWHMAVDSLRVQLQGQVD